MKKAILSLVLMVGVSNIANASDRSCRQLVATRKATVQKTWEAIKDHVTMDKMGKLYDVNVKLIDFQYSDTGLQKLTDYWESTRSKYELGYVRYDSSIEGAGDTLYVKWTIMIQTKPTAIPPSMKLASHGISELKFHPCSTKVFFQRDYLDPIKPVAEFPAAE